MVGRGQRDALINRRGGEERPRENSLDKDVQMSHTSALYCRLEASQNENKPRDMLLLK